MKNKTLICGRGEVGKALYEVLSKTYCDIFIKDIEDLELNEVRYLHLCYPYSEMFINIALKYIEKYQPEFVIIHSTVKIGTTEILQKLYPNLKIYHSPIRGVHPYLAEGIRTFTKFIGGNYDEEIEQYFNHAGINTSFMPNSKTTELLKIMCTTYYGWNIVFCKEIQRICKEQGVEFDDVYGLSNITYNRGYTELGMDNVVRPNLKAMPGKIGGHCVINNCKLFDDKITKLILDFDKGY